MKYYDYKGVLCSQKYYEQYRSAFISKCQELLNDHNRGNIYDENPMLFMSWTGPAYMDTIKRYYGEMQ